MGWFTLLVFFCLVVYSRRFRKACMLVMGGLIVLGAIYSYMLSSYDDAHPVKSFDRSGVYMPFRSTPSHQYM